MTVNELPFTTVAATDLRHSQLHGYRLGAAFDAHRGRLPACPVTEPAVRAAVQDHEVCGSAMKLVRSGFIDLQYLPRAFLDSSTRPEDGCRIVNGRDVA